MRLTKVEMNSLSRVMITRRGCSPKVMRRVLTVRSHSMPPCSSGQKNRSPSTSTSKASGSRRRTMASFGLLVSPS
jgi:hypothetical protein